MTHVRSLSPRGGDLSGGVTVAAQLSVPVDITQGPSMCRFGALPAVNGTILSMAPRSMTLVCIAPVCVSPLCEEGAVALEVSLDGGTFTNSRQIFVYSDVRRLARPATILPLGGPRRGGTPLRLADAGSVAATLSGSAHASSSNAQPGLSALAAFQPQLRLGDNSPVNLPLSKIGRFG